MTDSTDFSFQVKVLNDPPYFTRGLEDQNVRVGDI